MHPVATRGSIGQFLAGHADESVQLAVLAGSDVDQIAYLVWPQSLANAQHGEHSVLIVPHPLHVSTQPIDQGWPPTQFACSANIRCEQASLSQFGAATSVVTGIEPGRLVDFGDAKRLVGPLVLREALETLCGRQVFEG
jgi:hypothetical protein